MATLAFHAFRRQRGFQSDDKIRLITFAAPLAGDSEFVAYFESANQGRYVHVANRGDPVTYLPPMSLSDLWRLRPLILTPWTWILGAASVVWRIYTHLYPKQRMYAAWAESKGVKRLGSTCAWICLLQHTRSAYHKRLDAESHE